MKRASTIPNVPILFRVIIGTLFLIIGLFFAMIGDGLAAVGEWVAPEIRGRDD